MKRIALISSSSSELVRVLADRGAEVATGGSAQSAISVITPALRDGTVDAVLLTRPDEHEAGMVNAWARSLASFLPATRFIGVGDWCAAGAQLEPGCTLERLLDELGLVAVDGDGDVIVAADGGLDRSRVEPVPDEPEQAPPLRPRTSDQERFEQSPGAGDTGWRPWGSDPGPDTAENAAWGAGGREPGSGAGEGARPAPAPASGSADEARGPASFAPWGRPRDAAPAEATDVSDWSRVVFLVSGRGGVGRSSLAINIAERAAGSLKRDVILIDANIGQGGLATNLRVVRAGAAAALPTIADLGAGANVQQVVCGAGEVRASGGAAISFASVLAPDPDQATPAACSPQRYRRVIDQLAPVSDLLVVDTCVSWQADPTRIASDLVAPGLRAGASVLVVSDASLEGAEGARRLVRWAGRLAPGRVAGLLNMAPASAVPDQATASRLFKPAPCLAVIPYDESVRLRAAAGRPVHRLLGLAADRVLSHLGVA